MLVAGQSSSSKPARAFWPVFQKLHPTLVSHFFTTDRHGYSWACIAAIMRQAQAINQDYLRRKDIRISRSGPCNGNLEEIATPHTAFLDIPGNRTKKRPIPKGHILIHVEGWVEKELGANSPL